MYNKIKQKILLVDIVTIFLSFNNIFFVSFNFLVNGTSKLGVAWLLTRLLPQIGVSG